MLFTLDAYFLEKDGPSSFGGGDRGIGDQFRPASEARKSVRLVPQTRFAVTDLVRRTPSPAGPYTLPSSLSVRAFTAFPLDGAITLQVRLHDQRERLERASTTRSRRTDTRSAPSVTVRFL